MNILLTTFWGLPQAGGVDLYISQLKLGLERRGHHVDVLSRLPDGSGYTVLNQKRVIPRSVITSLVTPHMETYFQYHLPEIDPLIREAEVERYCFEAGAAYLDIHSYDLIHAQDVISARALSRIKHPRTALVTTIHGYLAKEWFYGLEAQGVLKDMNRRRMLWHYASHREQLGIMSSNETILPTQWMRGIMEEQFSISEGRMSIVPNGFDIEGFLKQMNAYTEVCRPPDRKVFICPARFDVVKGHVYLIRALAKLKRDRSDWVCWLVGNGGLELKLRELTKVHGIEEHVVFHGLRSDVPALLKQADVFVLASLQDNHPFAVMEAQVAAKTIIVSDAGGMPEMVAHDENGLVFPVGDDEQLYQHLRSVMNDQALCDRLSHQAQSSGNHRWSLDTMMAQVSAVYESALHHHRGG
ncbi:glycosyltransferase family 4 protein [Paenibacillus alginolyticus]|uniref:glycosyltransferase family 4 protein n=1 Tax=Paenibacillus alginolyticus TaxID=59839 RepID=UPI00041C4880|nr:glycosyltransferase family 4 protein [Paenibacillus alginolyticus]MCY9668256.1 glycosyltransferase family 4 protein [Paenibacillus alginolyticus]